MTKKYKVYYASNGQLQYGEQKVNGKWYYFSEKTAYMTTGLQTVGKYKKYYASNGQRKTGYQKIKGKGYYFDKKRGVMFIKKFAFVGGRDYYALSNGVLHAPTWHSQFTTIYAPEGCAVASSATLLSIKSRSFNMRYAYNNLPQYGGVYSTANFRGLLSVSSLTNCMKKFDGGFTNITGSSMAEIQSVVKSGHPVLYYGFSSYETYFRDKHHAKVIAGYKNGRFLVYDPCYYSAGSGSSHRNVYDYGAIAWVRVSTVARESTGGSNNQVEDRTGLVAYCDGVLPALEANYNRPPVAAAEGMLLPIDADSGVLVGNYWQVNISCFFTLDLVRNLIGFD